MKRIAPYLTALVILTACTTLPDRVDDKYLTEKNQAESELLNKIEKDIIEKNRAKKGSEEIYEAKLKAPEFTEKEVELLEKENRILKDQISLYEKYKEARSLEERKLRLAENEASIKRKKMINEYLNADMELAEADLEIKKADLAVSVAELEFERSKIAAAYRERTETGEKEEKGFFAKLTGGNDPEDKYGYKKYGEFLEKKREELKKAEEKYSEAEKKYNEAKKKIDAIK